MPLRLITVIVLLGAAPCAAVPHSPEDGVDVPGRATRFVEKGTRAIAFETADLNRDGRQDAILVIEPVLKPGDDEHAERPRQLLVLVGEADGSYREAKRNGKVVYCSACGGMMGDPFQGVDVGPGTFTVSNAGGSSWRWGVSYRFNYSRRDDTWQLVRVDDETFHAGDPAESKTVVSTPPKHFGKIDLADFDPENWKGQGAR
jgi:hypothetical protein